MYHRINENGEIVSYGDAEEDYSTDVLAGKATEYIGRTANEPQPFFMYLATSAPHEPFTPAPRHKEEFADAKAPRLPSFNESDVSDKPSWLRDNSRLYSSAKVAQIDELYRGRLQMLLAIDEMISDLIGALEDSGKLESTYIVFTSDHGYHLGEHRRQGKESAYEEDIRVPLIVRGPGVTPGRVLDQFVLNIDFAPTFAELAGVSAPDFIDGCSLVPLLTDDTPPTDWRSAFLVEHWNEYAQQWMIPDYKGVRTSKHIYVEYGSGDYEYYDLQDDSYELVNFYEIADPTLVTQLKSQLEMLSNCGGEVCRSTM
jgi:N-acetylglucosamine-6-sulfatase